MCIHLNLMIFTKIIRGFIRAELGKLLNISQQQISRYERGINKIPIDILFHILNIFDISISDFFEKVSKRVITLKYKIKYDSDNNIPFFENII
ncbi:helix-turn-helix domain-containing protein [Proteus mirabilis]|uniref:helix-turn-helix domain-containing protein n=2 Tax=Proteus mirabilis TaxID=584 RepID=UPI0027D9B132|nr:helix-turn-helix transcriptional regulator [Proteus mirabilis]